jgi:SAM-dependent methyltransferase
MALPFAADRFDAAVMALVVVFVPEPAKGVDEMVRVVRPGGTVATYVWDMLGDGFPLDPLLAEMRAMGLSPPAPPQLDASRMDALRDLWAHAGLIDVEMREITVQRTFASFDEFWAVILASSAGQMVSAMPAGASERLEDRMRIRLPADPEGRITCSARANAVKGRHPQRG